MQYRPDLIIADDLEDNESVKTLDGRNKTYDWLTTDVIPAGERNTRLIVVGTLLHEDSLMMRLKKEIQNGKRSGEYREYPLIDDIGNILWSGKYPDQATIDSERMRIGDEKSWHQEYLLRIISDSDRVVHPEWITYYQKLPDKTPKNEFRGYYIGIDLAISERERADCTAMVPVAVYGWGEEMRIYVLPFVANDRIDFPTALERAQALSSSLTHNGRKARLYIEDNQYQRVFVQMMVKESYPAEGITSLGDKRTRLTLTNPAIKSGKVFFPTTGAAELIPQLVGFGSERHDDLADAFAIVVGKIIKDNKPKTVWGDISYANAKPITAGLMDMIF